MLYSFARAAAGGAPALERAATRFRATRITAYLSNGGALELFRSWGLPPGLATVLAYVPWIFRLRTQRSLVAIVVAVILVFWRGAVFMDTITTKITESERRLGDKITESGGSAQGTRLQSRRVGFAPRNQAALTTIETKVDRLTTKVDEVATEVKIQRARQEET